MRCAFWVVKSRALVQYPHCILGRFEMLVGCTCLCCCRLSIVAPLAAPSLHKCRQKWRDEARVRAVVSRTSPLNTVVFCSFFMARLSHTTAGAHTMVGARPTLPHFSQGGGGGGVSVVSPHPLSRGDNPGTNPLLPSTERV